MDNPIVGIVMGSDSDWPLVKKACETLDKFGVGYETYQIVIIAFIILIRL